MENYIQIAQIILLLSLAVLAFYLVVVLSKFKDVIISFSKDFNLITSKAIPVLENLEVVTTKVKTITENIDEQLLVLKSSVETIKSITENIASFEKKIQDEIESPVMEVVGLVVGLIKKISGFFRGTKK